MLILTGLYTLFISGLYARMFLGCVQKVGAQLLQVYRIVLAVFWAVCPSDFLAGYQSISKLHVRVVAVYCREFIALRVS